MCVNCIRNQVDISEGLPKQVTIQFCRACSRYNQPPAHWISAELESKELLTYCLKRIRGLNKVKLVDASFVWTEPHSKRLKVKLTIQKEVMNGAILQQAFVIEYVITNLMCDDCHRVEAQVTWHAVAQVRQRVKHKRTFYWLEQVILKHGAHADAFNIVETADGLDFYYGHVQKCRRLIDFLTNFVPLRYTEAKKLVSWDEQNAEHSFKETFSVELAPVCKHDLVCLPPRVAQRMGSIAQVVLCIKITNSIHVMDVNSLQTAEINSLNFFKEPFLPLGNSRQMTEYVVINIEKTGQRSGKFALADVEVARSHELGTDKTVLARTHLGNILHVGDFCVGYDVVSLAYNNEHADRLEQQNRMPDVVLVKKTYPDRANRAARRIWQLKRLNMSVDESVREADKNRRAQDFEVFMRNVEEDREARGEIDLYANRSAIEQKVRRKMERERQQIAAIEAGEATPMDGAGGLADENDELYESDIDDDFPEVELTELLDDLSLNPR